MADLGPEELQEVIKKIDAEIAVAATNGDMSSVGNLRRRRDDHAELLKRAEDGVNS